MDCQSLIQCLGCGDKYVGKMGVLCGYSADAECMEALAGRFTDRSGAQRSVQGYPSLLVMLDTGCKPLGDSVPGVLQLLAPSRPVLPWNLLHAKVGLLVFQHKEDSTRRRVRLLVSTGNWTRQTLMESLDLAWYVDVDTTALQGKLEGYDRLACADIKAAWDLMQWLVNVHASDILSPRVKSVLAEHWSAFRCQLNEVSSHATGTSRFVDNRSKPLLKQLHSQIVTHAGNSARNYLAMGSGYFEQVSDGDGELSTLNDISQELIKNGLLSKGACVEVYVNENACQGLAKAGKYIGEQGWKICKPLSPSGDDRFLHAKFLFGASCRNNSKYCLHPWVYLGSGNLTRAGFALGAKQQGGNLEAGVVFTPEKICWYTKHSDKSCPCISDLLPISKGRASILPNDGNLAAGKDFDEGRDQYFSPPVSYAQWDEQKHQIHLPSSGKENPCDILQPNGEPCERYEQDFIWLWERPARVELAWMEGGKVMRGSVPVLDEYGNLGARLPPAENLKEAMGRLLAFPTVQAPDEPPHSHRDKGSRDKSPGGKQSVYEEAAYPIRNVMILVEKIAAKQLEVDKEDWSYWCHQLEQSLVEVAGSENVREIAHALSINPLRALYARPFRPEFTFDAKSEEGRAYERALRHVEEAWALTGKTGLGEEI